ncbi:MAG: YceI family protein [Oceanobacter sp.]
MTCIQILKQGIAGIALAIITLSAQADWLVQPSSEVSFVTTKNLNKSEVHTLSDVKGVMTDDGAVDISIALSSLETGIPIRNERMLEMLFAAVDFPDIKVSSEAVSSDALEAIKSGAVASFEQPAKLTIRDQSIDISLKLVASFSADGTLLVSTASPVLIDARTLGLDVGVDALRTVAGLESISYLVPVSFVLTLK